MEGSGLGRLESQGVVADIDERGWGPDVPREQREAENHAVVPERFRLVEVNELPRFSPWPARLLGLSDWTPRHRNDSLVTAEYGEKWGALLYAFRQNRFRNLEDTISSLLKTHFPPNLLFHLGEQIYYSETDDFFWNYLYHRIAEVLRQYVTPSDTLVELGCGWGRNLFFAVSKGLCKNAFGGEYTEEGVRLGELVAKTFRAPIEFAQFDYCNPREEVLERLRGAVIFTHNSIEQIRNLPEKTVNALIDNEPKAVVHFEPVYEYREEDSLLHCLWKRYTEVNDYNRDLLTVLRKLEQIGRLKIELEKVHELGLNAFNPGSFIVWTPRKTPE